jgi:hypothetical protein
MGLIESVERKGWWGNLACIAVIGPERRDNGPLDRSKVSSTGMSVAEGNGKSLG